jgi:hypothetical protein
MIGGGATCGGRASEQFTVSPAGTGYQMIAPNGQCLGYTGLQGCDATDNAQQWTFQYDSPNPASRDRFHVANGQPHAMPDHRRPRNG